MSRKLFSIGLACLIALFFTPYFVRAQDSGPMVHLVYFRSSDTPLRPNVDAEIDALIKKVQLFFTDEMERHGYGRKTFQFETDASGNAVVHHVVGKFTYTHYAKTHGWVQESEEQIKFPNQRIIVYMIDTQGADRHLFPVAGLGGGSASGGFAHIFSWAWQVLAHELGHAFGLSHDFRNSAYIMSYGIIRSQLSQCAAEFLDIHGYFNSKMVDSREGLSAYSKVEMLPPIFVSPPNTIRLQFTLTDPDGLYQAQLLRQSPGQDVRFSGLISCKRLNGDPSSTVEFVLTNLAPKTEFVRLLIIDMRGKWALSQWFPIDVNVLLPPAKVISIPDAILAAGVREQIGNLITTQTILNLRTLYLYGRGVRDLTGIEHAYVLTFLHLLDNSVSDISSLANLTHLTELDLRSNNISDISSLAKLTQLAHLHLSSNNISDVSALSELTNLTLLELDSNNISDISPLTGLTHLTSLELNSNNISDISHFAGMPQLESLYLHDNNISDVFPLTGMTQLRRLALGNNISDVSSLSSMTQLESLRLDDNNISDVSALSELTNLTWLYLGSNNISDISALSGLTQLESLRLDGNNISDVSALSELANLTLLQLFNNNISDISALSGLTNLTTLSLESNNISDVSPLLALNLTGTQWNSTGLYLRNNPLSYVSINTHIPAMQAKGIEVSFDNVAHPALSIVSGNNQQGFAGSVLSSLFVVEVQNENGEPMEGIPVTFTVETGNGQLISPTATTDADGRAQTNLMLGWTPGRNTVRVTGEGIESWATFSAIGMEPETQIAEDVNRDGVVDVEDLVLVAATLGTIPPDGTIPNTDVNGDGIVNSDDLALVMAALENTPTAPAAADNLQRWINEAKQLTNKDETFLRGIEVLEQLLATLLPKKTALLANYPNPFNPETWIPYHLAKPAEVTVCIYAVNGTLIRTLSFGHKAAGIYEHRNRAAHWDGKNAQGEHVASGIYFYTLTAGDFTSTRKMLIRK